MQKYKINSIETLFTYAQVKERYPNISFPSECLIDLELLASMGISIEQPSLDEFKIQKLAQIQMWTQAAITNGFESNCAGVQAHFDSDVDTQITMQGIALNVNTEQFATEYPQGCPVRGYTEGISDKTIFMLSAAQVLQFCADLSKHIGQQKQHGWELQQAVAAVQTAEELNSITW